jgi:hypothetical protein
MKVSIRPGADTLRRAFRLLLFLLLVANASVAQRIVHERAFSIPRFSSTGVNSMLVTQQGLIALALGHITNQGTGVATGSYRLLNNQLDTVWTLSQLTTGDGRNPIQQLPCGDLIGGCTIAGTTPTGRGEGVEKVSVSGELRWSKSAYVLPDQVYAIGMAPLPDNGWLNVMWGPQNPTQFRQRSVLYKTDSAGTVVWQQPYGWDVNEYILHLQRNPVSGRILLAGMVPPVGGQPGMSEYKLLLVNAAGDSIRGRRLAPLGARVRVGTQHTFNSLLPLPDGAGC